MLFQGLSRLKRTSIMTTIVLMVIGFCMVICPDPYVQTLIDALGFVMVIGAIVSVLDFLGSKKALIHFIYLTVALIFGIMGTVILLFDVYMLRILGWWFGALLVLGGVYSIFHALIFARRSGRKGWWVLIILSVLLMCFGGFIFYNPWWTETGALIKVIGGTLLFSAVVSALRLIWVWPIRND